MTHGGVVEELVAKCRDVATHQAAMLASMVAVADATPASEFAVFEISCALHLTRQSAASQLELAVDLVRRLPSVHAALACGDLDLPRARLIRDAVAGLDLPLARQVANAILPDAPALTTGKLGNRLERLVIEADPDGSTRRSATKQRARRVTVQPTGEGCAALFGLDLPAADTVAAANRLAAIARAVKRAGDPRSMDQLRADTLLDLLLGRPTGSGSGLGAGGVELVASLDTLTGLTQKPGHLNGYGPVIASIARQIAQQQRDKPWTYTIHDPKTGDIYTGTTRLRPTAPNDFTGSSGPSDSTGSTGVRGSAGSGNPGDAAGSGNPGDAAGSGGAGDAAGSGNPGDGAGSGGARDGAGSGGPGGLAGSGGVTGPPNSHRAKPSPSRAASPSRSGPGTHPAAVRPSRSTQSRANTGPRPPRPNPATSDPRQATQSRANADSGPIRPDCGTSGSSRTAPSRAEAASPGPDNGYGSRPENGCAARLGAVAGEGHADQSPPNGGRAAPPGGDRVRRFGDPRRRFPNAALARHVRARDRTCRAPGCRRPASRTDLDHTIAYEDGGLTVHENLGALCRWHHRAKHDGGWELQQISPGHFVWRSPLGHWYYVLPEPP